MSDLLLSSKEKKTLKNMKNRRSVPAAEIYNCQYLYQMDLIAPNHTKERDLLNAPISDGTYHLTEKYQRYAEETRWFNGEFVIRNIIVPILVGVLSVVITRFLIGP